ncbi:hypothetical protein E4U42_005282 [Claviceps africana]|uniref:Uncharacterized protein n=1 Tax=Claviceps africana TaxID=83212 RepID=A0A8K0JEL9_9HYPO|nr:hypothetical protein E4U42_005282 [Claviceps africana]
MCQVTYFHHATCRHKWAVISRPCAPGLGFSNCPSFLHEGSIKETPRVYRTKARVCPRCAEGVWDGNLVRVVKGMGWGLRIGGGGEGDWGVDVRVLEGGCCAVL